jgi:geranylgeranyl diphosphate synthase type I
LGKDDATAEEIHRAILVLHDCGSIEHARRTAQDYSREAKEHLECLSPTKEREFLAGLMDFAVGREL